MAYKQLIKPDLKTQGTIGNCKIYARSVFHIPSTGRYPTAWSNWLEAKYKHHTPIPEDVAILVWFSGYGGAGHVAVSVPGKGFYSSPYSYSKTAIYQQGTNTRAVLPSIAQLERTYGVDFVGWTEDIEDERVAVKIEGDEPMREKLLPEQRMYQFTQDTYAVSIPGNKKVGKVLHKKDEYIDLANGEYLVYPDGKKFYRRAEEVKSGKMIGFGKSKLRKV